LGASKFGGSPFFYDAKPQANTFHADNRGRVLFEGGDFNSLERRPVPPSLPAQLVYETARVSGKLEGTLPESPSKWLPLTDDFIYDHYETLFRKHFLGRPKGLMMGWPMLIQSAEGDMESLATRRTGKQGDWVLLMQFGSSLAAPQWSWGDYGRLYYWIRREDLLERRFDSIWTLEEDH